MNGAVEERFAVVLDGNNLPNSGTPDALEFTFEANATAGNSNYMMVEAVFVDGDLAEAKYELEITGSTDQPYPIKRSDSTFNAAFNFEVTA
jgi:hypothetical protein